MRVRAMLMSGLLLLSGLFFLWQPTTPAFACSCVGLTLDEQAVNAEVVAEAVIRGVESNVPGLDDGEVGYSAVVTKLWKGQTNSQITVVSASHEAACGISAPIGETIVLFANGPEPLWRTNICNGTAPQRPSTAAELTATLGEPRQISTATNNLTAKPPFEDQPATDQTSLAGWLLAVGLILGAGACAGALAFVKQR